MSGTAAMEGAGRRGAWPAEGQVVPVGPVRLTVKPGDHPLYAAHRAEVAANWEHEIAANPALYNGRLIMLDRLFLEAGRPVTGEGYEIPYAMHLWWRRQADPGSGIHCFAWAVPLSADGAVIAAEMAPHTANPGLVYCAAGSLEPEDVAGNAVDVPANMAREVREEIGLDLTQAAADPGYFALHLQSRVTLFRIYRFAETAAQLVARIEAFLADGGDGEISRVVAIRSADPAAHRYSAAMPPLLAHVFGSA